MQTLTCRTCGDIYDLPDHLEHAPCRSCGTENCRPQAEGESLEKLNRANRLLREGEFAEAEACYRHVLVDFDDEHPALWGKLLCQYGVEFVTDPKSGVRHATVHVPRTRPMQLHADFRRACELAPEAVRAQYEAEAAYVDAALAEINRHKASSPPYDVFICHKTTYADSEDFTRDYNRGVLLTRLLEREGYRVFFAPFADLEPGASYEAGIYYALDTAKVMLVIASDAAFLTSPWVKSEWSRYLEMLDDGADKHLISLMYAGLPESRMPREIRLRGLQSIRMDEDPEAKDKLLAAMGKHCGAKAEPEVPKPVSEPVKPEPPRPEPVPEPVKLEPKKPAPAPEKPKPMPVVQYAPEEDFMTEPVDGGVSIIGYYGPGGVVAVPPMIGGEPVVYIGMDAFENCETLTQVEIPEGVTSIGYGAFWNCSSLTSVTIPDGVTSIGEWAFGGCSSLESITIPDGVTSIGKWAFIDCSSLTSITIPDSVTSIGNSAFEGCSSLESITIPDSVTSIGDNAFWYCDSLTSITIPDSVTSIGEKAFASCPNLTLRVHEGSAAHAYAQENGLRFELIRPAPAPQARPQASTFNSRDALSKPSSQPARVPQQPAPVKPAAPATLTITRTKRFAYAARKIVVRIDRGVTYTFGNGESGQVNLTPGVHQIDLRLKPLLGNITWGDSGCRMNVYPMDMQSGAQYTLDLADWVNSL